MITPLKTVRTSGAAIVGFDTEYTSKGNDFLSCQLSHQGEASFNTQKITVDRLAKWVRDLGVQENEAILVSYFSLAELQFLPVKDDSFAWREYGNSFDCTFSSDRHNLSLRVFDLARFFERQSLAKVAESFGYRKLAWKTDRVTRADLKKKGFREYAINDAIITEGIFNALRMQFMERGTDIAITETAARSAADTFRHTYVTKPLENRNNRVRYCALRAAWGGRAEAFGRGAYKQLYEYDIQSAYPNAAISFGCLPVGKDWKELNSLSGKWRGGVAHVRFSFPARELYPCLPTVTKSAMLYPLEGQEWLTLDEITYAREIGAKVTLLEGWAFRTGTKVLSDFLSAVLAERAIADGARKAMLKLLSNSLIGKLAQRTAKLDIEQLWKVHLETGIDIEDLLRLPPEEALRFGLNMTYSVGSCYMPEWNALITGRVRAIISRLARDYSAVYCATDAVWLKRKLAKPPEGTSLKRSGAGFVARTRLGFLGKEHTVHHSILRRDVAREMLEADDGKARKYQFSRPLHLREALRSGKTVGKWIRDWRTASIQWDNKRKLLPDGTSVPWRSVSDYLQARKEAEKNGLEIHSEAAYLT